MMRRPTRSAEIELRAIEIVRRVKSNLKVEDDLVELKSRLTEPVNFAKTIAGLANAARGEEALVIVGVDEKTGAVSPNIETDLASFWAKVASFFDGPCPDHRVVVAHLDEGPVTVFVLDTEAAPFVVSSQAGAKEAGSLEVPWRSGTSTRRARRNDLLKLLVPRMHSPSIEVLDLTMAMRQIDRSAGAPQVLINLQADLYVTSISERRTWYPDSLVTVSITFGENHSLKLDGGLYSVDTSDLLRNTISAGFTRTAADLRVDGCGPAWLLASSLRTRDPADACCFDAMLEAEDVAARVEFSAAGADSPHRLATTLSRRRSEGDRFPWFRGEVFKSDERPWWVR